MAGSRHAWRAARSGSILYLPFSILVFSSASMRILGIDPGLKLTGYGILDWTGQEHPLRPPALVDAGVIRLDAKAQMPARLLELEQELGGLFKEYKPDVCAVEML